MTDFRVAFFNRLPDSYGRMHRVCQRSIVVRQVDGSEQAIEVAKSDFARAEHVGDWRFRACEVDCEELQDS